MEARAFDEAAERVEFGVGVGHAGEAEQIDRRVAARLHDDRDALLDVRERIAARVVVRGVDLRARRVQAGAHRVEAGVAERPHHVGATRVAVQVDRAARARCADPARRFDEDRTEERGLPLAALSEADHAARHAREVRERGVGNLARRRRDVETIVARTERAVGLQRDAADALRVARDRNRQRSFVPAEKEVLRSATPVLERAALELTRDAIARQLDLDPRDAVLDALLREAPRVLAAVWVGAERAHPILIIGPADRRVRIERQRRRLASRAPRRVMTRRVRRRDERGDCARLAAFPARDRDRRPGRGIETHRRATGQREQVTAARQRDQLACGDRLGSRAAHAGEQQLRMIVDASFEIADEQSHRLGGNARVRAGRVAHG